MFASDLVKPLDPTKPIYAAAESASAASDLAPLGLLILALALVGLGFIGWSVARLARRLYGAALASRVGPQRTEPRSVAL